MTANLLSSSRLLNILADKKKKKKKKRKKVDIWLASVLSRMSNLFCSLAGSYYLSKFSNCSLLEQCNSLADKFFSFCWLYKCVVFWLGLSDSFLSQNLRELYGFRLPEKESGMCTYHLFLRSKFSRFQNSLWIILSNNNCNEGVLHTPQISKTGSSPSDAVQCHTQKPTFWGEFRLFEIQSVYSKPHRQDFCSCSNMLVCCIRITPTRSTRIILLRLVSYGVTLGSYLYTFTFSF